MKKLYMIFTFFTLLLIGGCTNEPTPPADFWGVTGFSYESNKVSGGKRHHASPTATTTLGFEKQLGSGFGIGGEVSGVRG